ncbi:MAG: HAMP domain-containing histidine kinase [Actinomycetota bacterium]|nr:HAMP domain-containing histidine kinase [Actinomycetota bacterium]
MSLRRRLLVGLVAVAAVLVVTNVALSRTVESFLLARVDRQLVDVVSRPFLQGERGGSRRAPSQPDGGEDEALSEYFIAVSGPDGQLFVQLSSVLADEDESPPRLDAATIRSHLAAHQESPRPFTAPATTGEGSWRLVAVENRRWGVTVVGLSLADFEQTVGRIRLVQLLATLAVLAALALISRWMLRLGVHPIEDMARTADAIAAGDLSQRVDHPGPGTEAGRLGMALNAMLERIEEAFRAREASEERVRRFAADASHELRTPLTSIQGYTELWRAGGLRGDEELAEAMRRMEQEARRMGALVEDLLLLARLDQHRPLDQAPVRLDAIVADAVRDASAVEPDRPIEMVAEPATVDGDEMRLRQVVANLLSNARAHTPPGTPVRVTVAVEGDRARVEVADDGPGMEPEVAAKVFERFFRADPSRARAAGGTGLGLSIVAAVAEAHGGQAWVDAAPGRGSRFVVELPVASSSS